VDTNSEAIRRIRRPSSVTFVAVAGLFFSAFHLARLVLSLTSPPLPLSVPPWYLPLTGAIWGGLGMFLTIGLWRGSQKAYRWALWTIPAYLAWYWIDRLVFLRSDFAQTSRPAALAFTGAALVLLLGALTRNSAREFFRERTDE
jgi:hypothetical protein